MRISLWAHPANPSVIPLDVVASVERVSGTVLKFRFLVRGRIEQLIVPPPSSPTRSDNLWRTTCFEAFLFRTDSSAYVELNFSPSSQWAAYDFTAYRDGMVQASLMGAPDVQVDRQSDSLELSAAISLDAALLPRRLNLCAVVEELGGNISYWAADHPSRKPDFHRQDCFAMELPAASPA